MISTTLYYIIHSVWGTIRKIFSSWLALFFGFMAIMMVVGFLFGMIMGTLSFDTVDEAIDETAIEFEADDIEEEEDYTPEFILQMQAYGLGGNEIAIAITFTIMLAVVLVSMYVADKQGANIFNMADVNLLFQSPITPQQALSFRMTIMLGSALVMVIYFMFQIPNLMNILGLSLVQSLLIIFQIAIAFVTAQVVSMLSYIIVTSGKTRKTNVMRSLVFAVIIGIFGLINLKMRRDSLTILPAAIALLSSKQAMYVPIVGWGANYVNSVIESDMLGITLSAIMQVALIAVLFIIIKRIKIDFYEDALPGAEKNQLRLEASAQGKNTVEGEKKRSKLYKFFDKNRKNISRGSGVSMFFWKPMHIRRHEMVLGIFSVNSVFCIVAAIGLYYLGIYVLPEAQEMTFIFFTIVIVAMGFIGAFTNPLSQENGVNYLYIAPYSAINKLAFILLATVIDFLLTILPGMLVAILLRPKVSTWIMALLIAVMTYFFVTTVSLFASLIVPSHITDMVRTYMTMFIISFAIIIIMIPVLVAAIIAGGMAAGIAYIVSAAVVAIGALIPTPLILQSGKQ